MTAEVAILGRPEGRPPVIDAETILGGMTVAILGRPEGRPPARRWPAWLTGWQGLRSSAAPKGGRQAPSPAVTRWLAGCCDPRPPRRAAASNGVLYVCTDNTGCDPRPPRRAAASRGCPGGADDRGSCDPRPPRRAAASSWSPLALTSVPRLRSSAAPKGGRQRPRHARLSPVRVGCDPRPPRRAAASAVQMRVVGELEGVAILGRPEGRPPASGGGGVS